MSNKQEKKLRQVARREARAMYAATVEAIAERDTRFLKPKPGWVPTAVYMWALGFFVNIKKSKRV